MTVPKNNFVYIREFGSKSDRDKVYSRLVAGFTERKIDFLFSHPLGKKLPEFSKYLAELQTLDRCSGESPYELFVQIYSKNPLMPNDLPTNLTEVLNLEGLVLLF